MAASGVQQAPHSPSPRRAGSGWAAGLIAAEAAILLFLAAFYGVEVAAGRAADTAGAVSTLLFLVLMSALVALLARGLRDGRGWARTPALLLQVFVLIGAWPVLVSDRWFVGVPIALLAVAAAVVLLVGRRAPADESV